MPNFSAMMSLSHFGEPVSVAGEALLECGPGSVGLKRVPGLGDGYIWQAFARMDGRCVLIAVEDRPLPAVRDLLEDFSSAPAAMHRSMRRLRDLYRLLLE